MKSLHKKIGAVALAVMMVAGGVAAVGIKAHANPISKFNSDQSVGQSALWSLLRAQNRFGSRFRIIYHNLGGQAPSSESRVLKFNNALEFYENIEPDKRGSYGLVVGEEQYSAQIGELFFKFKLIR